MHGRFLLPGVFAVVLPAALIRVGRRSAASLLSVAVLVAWASWAGPWLRTQEGEVGPRGIADERGFWVRRATDKTPVTLGSYADTWFARTGRTATAQLGLGRLLLFPKGHDSDEVRAYPMSLSVGPDVVIVAGNVGILGYSANSRVHVVDRGGLGDPHTSRVELAARSRPGHEKSLPVEWVLARFADPTLGPSDPRTEAARRALRCGRLRTLSEAVSEPLTLGRFMRNVLAAPTLTALRIPRDPGEAEVRFC